MGREARERGKEDFQAIVAGVSAAMGVEADLELVEGYPCCDNDPAMTALVRRSAAALLGEENVLQLREPSLGADDFGCFSELVPGCYYYVGVGNAAKGFTSPNHNPHFAVDPAALPIAAALHARAALAFLGCIRQERFIMVFPPSVNPGHPVMLVSPSSPLVTDHPVPALPPLVAPLGSRGRV